MATKKQREAARENVRKAQQAAKRRGTLKRLPRDVHRELGKQGARGARRGGEAGHRLEDRNRRQLYELARELDVRGRSKMGKGELIEAIRNRR